MTAGGEADRQRTIARVDKYVQQIRIESTFGEKNGGNVGVTSGVAMAPKPGKCELKINNWLPEL